MIPGCRWRDGWRPCRTESRRADHPDNAQHFPLRRRLLQERNAGRAAAEGAHQHLQEAQVALSSSRGPHPEMPRR